MTGLTGNSFFFEWEVRLIVWLQTVMGPAGEKAAEAVSFLGDEILLVAVMALIYLCLDKKLGELLAENLSLSLCWNPMLKNAVLRLRPYMVHPEVKCLKLVAEKADIYDLAAQGYSLPSGHASNVTAAYGSLAVFLKKKKIMAAAAAACLLVGASRFMLGVHYPTDVLAGYSVGILSILAAGWLRKVIPSRDLMRFILLLTALPGWFFCTSHDFYSGFGVMLGIDLALLFEHRFVRFENTRSLPVILVRLAGAAVIFLVLNTLMTLPFSEAFLEAKTFLPHLVRSLRYTILVFCVCGVYPLTFRHIRFTKSGK